MSSFLSFFIFLLQLHSIPWLDLPGLICPVPIFKHLVWASVFFCYKQCTKVLLHKWIYKKNYRSWTSRTKSIFVLLIDITKLLYLCTVMIYTPTSNMWMCLFSHSLFYKMCQVNSPLYTGYSLSASYSSCDLCHKFCMQRQKFPGWTSCW